MRFRNIGGEQPLTRRARRFLLRQGFGGTSRDTRKQPNAQRAIEPTIHSDARLARIIHHALKWPIVGVFD